MFRVSLSVGVVGYWFVRCQLPFVGCFIVVVTIGGCCWLLFVGCWLSCVGCKLSVSLSVGVVGYWLSGVGC
jgi:hypothetical protein